MSKFGIFIVILGLGFFNASGQQPSVADVIAILQSRASMLEKTEVTYDLTIRPDKNIDAYLQRLNNLRTLIDKSYTPIKLGYAERVPIEISETCSLRIDNGKFWMEYRDLQVKDSHPNDIGFNGTIWYVFDPISKHATISAEDLRRHYVNYEDCLRDFITNPNRPSRGQMDNILDEIKSAGTAGSIEIKPNTGQAFDFIAYKKWPDSDSLYMGYKISVDPSTLGLISKIETFKAVKNNGTYQKIGMYSVVTFDDFEQIGGKLASPKSIKVVYYTDLTQSNDPELIRSKGLNAGTVNSYPYKVAEFKVQNFRAITDKDNASFEPTFPTGSTVFDRITGNTYSVGDPIKNMESQLNGTNKNN